MTALLPDTRVSDDGVGRGTHAFFLLAAAFVGAFFAWAAVGRLDVVSAALGEVIPSTQVKSVQHLEGGIVREIHVKEGDTVEEGQPLVSLAPTQSDADVQELAVRIRSLKADVARLEAEAAGMAEPKFPDDLLLESATLVRQTTDLFKARRNRIENELAGQRELVIQNEQMMREISARIETYRNRIKFVQEQIKISEELLKEELTNRMLHLNLLKEEADLKGKTAEDTAALSRADAAARAARLRLAGIRDGYQQDVRAELEGKRRELGEMSNRVEKYADSLRRTVVRSPVAGVVKTLRVVTVGGVIKAGDTVVDIVPGGDRLIVEAKLPVQDIGYVQSGQTAVIQLASTDAVRFGTLHGEVIHVAPDTLETKSGVPYYRVRIATERDRFERGGARYQLVPGVQVTCSILTGTRSVLEYILDPFLRSAQTALRER